MPVSVAEFWKLVLESRLATIEQLRPIKQKFATVKGAETQGNATTLAEWLVANGVLSRYQAKVLMSGRPGPFRFGEYVVYDRHGGPFKGVFKAIHPPTRQQIVLAFFTGAATQNPHFWSIIVQQMAVFARAVHPHLCRVYQVCDNGSYKFAVLEYVRGQSAAQHLANSAMSWGTACRIVRQTALGLCRLYEIGQLHCEIRPANIWIDRQENAKLLLPPLARDPLALPGPINFAAAEPGWLDAASDYLAPELAQPGQGPNSATDVYALGCTLFELIARRPPFTGDVNAKLRSHAADPLPSLESIGVPPLVAHVLDSMTAKNPALRFQHPQQVADAIGGILQQFEPAQLAVPATPTPATQANYDAWLADQPVVPSLPELAAPPIASEVPDASDPTAAGAFIPGSAAPSGAIADVAVMAPDAAPPVTAPQFEFNPADLPNTDAPATAEVAFTVPAEIAESVSVAERRASKRAKPGRKLLKVVAAIALVALVGGAAYVVATQLQDPEPVAEVPPNENQLPVENPPPNDEAPPDDENPKDANSDTTAKEDTGPIRVADDGSTLWESPTHGAPWKLEYVAPAVQSLLFLRPAELLKYEEGQKLLTALGPRGKAARDELEEVAGPLAEIERLTVAWVEPLTLGSTSTGGWPLVPMYIVRFAQPCDPELLIAKWGNPGAVTEGTEKVYQTALGSAFFPAKAEKRTLVIGPAAQVSDVIKQGDTAPPIRFELATLLQFTDDERLATLLVIPDVVLNSKSALFVGELQAIVPPALEFLGGSNRGANLSLHLGGQSLFLELRLLNAAGAPAQTAADQVKQRTAKVPESIERFVASLNPQPYGRFVLTRFPQMIKLLEEFTRVGSENNQTVLRCYLPGGAAHNLALGTELALAEASGVSAAPASVAANQTNGSPATASIAERLKRKTSLNFDRDTLEKAMILLAEDVGVKIEILGGDLQLDGITKNQSFGLDERDKPADEILRNIMLKANPDGKLVYVIKPKEPGGEEVLFITTRAAAAKRGDKLPAELALPKK